MQQLVGQRVLSPSPGAAYPPGRAPSPVPYGFAGPSGSQAPEPYNNIMQAQQAQRIQTQQIQIQQAHLPQQQSGPARVSSDPSGNDAGAPAAKQMKPKSAGTKRAAEGAPGDKPKEAKRSAQRKGKASDQDADAGAEKLNFFEEERETNIAMADLERHRRSGQAKACPVQLLSEWRLANEILRQMKAKGISGGQGGPAKAGASPDGATGSGASPSEVSIGFDEPLLAALQHAFKAHAQGLLTRAARAAQHRVVTSQKVPGFERGEDPRPRLGQIRKREEAAADAKAAEEREALLRAAGSRRADDETRERAQRAKAEMAGQQQAKAANKALAATLGGKDAKWAKWGGGAKKPGAAPSAKAAAEQGPEAAAAAAAAEENGHTTTMVTAAEELARAGAGGSLSAPRPPPVEAPGGGGGLEGAKVSVNDLIVALQQDPGYCNSAILYRLMNGMV